MARRPRPMSDRLSAAANARGGVFSRADALAVGCHEQDLCAWVGSGVVVRATRGGYYLPPDNEPRWVGASAIEVAAEHERRRVRAVLHVLPAAFVASHASALLLHGLPRLAPPSRRATVQVMATDWRRLPRRPGVKGSALIRGTILRPDVRAVAIADAIAQNGCVQGQLGALIPADAAMQAGRLDLADLAAACQRLNGHRGSRVLAAVVGLVDGRSESPGETWLRIVCHDAGIPVTPQVWIGDSGGRFARVDLLVDGTPVVLEFDGIGKYDSPAVSRAEKQREHRLHRAGYLVVRVMWEDFADIPALVGRIRATLARAAALAS